MNSTRVGSKVLNRSVRGALTVSVAAAVLLAVALPANAQDDGCKPAPARTETIPAKGEPTIVVENPDYVPGTDAVYTTIHHHAVTRNVVDQRWSWNPHGQVAQGQTPDVTGSNPYDNPDEWTSNTSSYNGEDPLNVAFEQGDGQGSTGSWFFWTTKTVVIQDAWTETVLWQAAVPAQGEPTIEKANPDYVPASTKVVAAVVCDAPKSLAATGSNAITVALIAGALALVGTVLTVVTRKLAASRR